MGSSRGWHHGTFAPGALSTDRQPCSRSSRARTCSSPARAGPGNRAGGYAGPAVARRVPVRDAVLRVALPLAVALAAAAAAGQPPARRERSGVAGTGGQADDELAAGAGSVAASRDGPPVQ